VDGRVLICGQEVNGPASIRGRVGGGVGTGVPPVESVEKQRRCGCRSTNTGQGLSRGVAPFRGVLPPMCSVKAPGVALAAEKEPGRPLTSGVEGGRQVI
jgi:hypothetical protein